MKILIVKLGAIGDAIMSLTMLTEIDRLHPAAKITWVCGTTIAPLLRTFKRIDEIIVIDDKLLVSGSKLRKAFIVTNLWSKLRGRNYDLVLIGHGDRAYQLLVRGVKATETRVFSRSESGRQWPIMGRHHADEYARLIAITDDFSMCKGEFPDVSHLKLPKTVSSHQPIVAIAPGGASTSRTTFEHRRWPIEQYVELARLLVKSGFRAILTGGPGDKWCSAEFNGIDILDTIGKHSIVEQIRAYSTYDLLVAHDSGPMHMASLAGTAVVALFGPTIPSRTAPRSPGSVVLWGGENLACRPCYDGRTYSSCSKNLCLESISPHEVLDSVIRLVLQKISA